MTAQPKPIIDPILTVAPIKYIRFDVVRFLDCDCWVERVEPMPFNGDALLILNACSARNGMMVCHERVLASKVTPVDLFQPWHGRAPYEDGH